MQRILKWINIPPTWLASALALAWLQKTHFAMGLSLGGVWADFMGGLLIGGGVVLGALAMAEMRRQRTTVIPHRKPRHLVTTGIFSRSRNPIYLGDSLILAGAILAWDAVLALPLIPLFVWLIEVRFILPEERTLRHNFISEFARYSQQTRRWF